MKPLRILLFCLWPVLWAPAAVITVRGPVLAPAAGGANNVTFVTGQKVNNRINNASTLDATMPGNVSSGNYVMVGIVSFDGVGAAFATSQLTKTAGTATIGTVVLRKAVNPTASDSGVCIYRVPVTGTGSLTLTFTSGSGNTYAAVGAAEFTGFNATPSDTDGTSSGSNATTDPEGSGTITTTTTGLLFYCASEQSTGDSTHTLSDVSVANYSTGSSEVTGVVQYRINGTTTPSAMTSAWGEAVAWRSVWCAEKTN